MRSRRSATCETSLSICLSSRMSVGTKRTPSPSSAARRSPPAASISATATFTPAARKARTTAAPISVAPPVTTAVLPSRPRIVGRTYTAGREPEKRHPPWDVTSLEPPPCAGEHRRLAKLGGRRTLEPGCALPRAAPRSAAGSAACDGKPSERAEPIPPQPRRRLGVQPVHELAEAHAPYLRQVAGAQDHPGERTIVGAAVPRLEMARERQRRARAVVGEQEGAPEGQEGLLLDRGERRAGDRLVREEVVVHRDDAEGMADERDLEQRQLPDAQPARRPRPERALPARVVAKASGGENGKDRKST